MFKSLYLQVAQLLYSYVCPFVRTAFPVSESPESFSYYTAEIFGEDFWIKGRIRSGGLLRIFTEAFLLFLAPAGGSNPAGLIFKPCIEV